MPQARIRAVFMRGGTSRAVIFRRADLPADRAAWAPIFLAALGSPDPNGRQVDGMGGGVTSLSKVCVVGPPTRPDADVDYTFAQVAVREAVVDMAGSCGNMASAIGPFAHDEGLLPPRLMPGEGEVAVRIHDTNAGRVILSRFAVAGGEALVEGDLALDGIAGTGAPVRLAFLDPGGGRSNGALLPSGRALDVLEVPGLGAIEATLVDAASPCAFIRAEAVGKRGTEAPADLEADPLFLARMEAVRRAAALAMGYAADAAEAGRRPTLPRIAMLAPPLPATLLSGRALGAAEAGLTVRMLSMGQPHRAAPATGALCLGVAARVPGSLAAALCTAAPGAPIRIAHPSGVTVVDAEVVADPARPGGLHCREASLLRTARRLFEGYIRVPAGCLPGGR